MFRMVSYVSGVFFFFAPFWYGSFFHMGYFRRSRLSLIRSWEDRIVMITFPSN